MLKLRRRNCCIIFSLLLFPNFPVFASVCSTVYPSELKLNIQYYPTSQPKKAITLVVHGLNTKPSSMLSIIEWLNQKGSDAYLVKLSGHDGSVNIRDVTSSMWAEDVQEGYLAAHKAAVNSSVPLFFLGYSLGALLGQAMVLFSDAEVCFDKQVLFAPATSIRDRSHLIKFFFVLPEKMRLPSFAPKKYRANNWLPVKAYKIMFENEKSILKAHFNKLNIPTIIFIDPKDELVSYNKLVKYSRKFALTNYEIIKLDSDLNGRKYHHMIIDELSMGKKNWDTVTQKMIKFLFD